MLWGCVSYNGVGNLVLIDGVMNGLKYVQILQENLCMSAEKMDLGSDFVFQQDSDPKHKSKIATEFFAENDTKVLDWPFQSPDLNIIDHVWSELMKKYGNFHAKTKSELFEKMMEIWTSFDRKYIENLIKYIYSRCNDVVDAKDGATRY